RLGSVSSIVRPKAVEYLVMKGDRLFAAAAGLALSTSTALAADIYPPAPSVPAPTTSSVPVVNWTGLDVGVNGGRRGERFVFFPHVVTAIAPGAVPLNFDRGLFGAQVGYNWQFAGRWLVGLEADLEGTDIQKVDNFTTVAAGGSNLTAGVALNRFGTVRPR